MNKHTSLFTLLFLLAGTSQLQTMQKESDFKPKAKRQKVEEITVVDGGTEIPVSTAKQSEPIQDLIANTYHHRLQPAIESKLFKIVENALNQLDSHSPEPITPEFKCAVILLRSCCIEKEIKLLAIFNKYKRPTTVQQLVAAIGYTLYNDKDLNKIADTLKNILACVKDLQPNFKAQLKKHNPLLCYPLFASSLKSSESSAISATDSSKSFFASNRSQVDSTVATPDLETDKYLKLLKTEGKAVFITLSDNAKIALTCTEEGKAYVWDLTNTRNCLKPASMLTQDKAEKLALDHEGKLALTYSRNRKLILWDLEQLYHPRYFSEVVLADSVLIQALAFDSSNCPVILLSENGNERSCSFSDFIGKLSLSELVLLNKIEQHVYKAERHKPPIDKCNYFKNLYANLPREIKKLADAHFNI